MSLSSAELTTYKKLYSIICKDLINNEQFNVIKIQGPIGLTGPQ